MRVVGADRVWAVGDITNRGAYTHMAVYQAAIAGDDILGVPHEHKAESHAVPRVVFCDPQIGGVGLTEEQCKLSRQRMSCLRRLEREF